MSTPFDPNAFLDLPVDQTFEKRPPLPVGDYIATISDLTARQWTSKDKYNADGSPKSGISYDISLTVEVPETARAQIGIDATTLKMRDSIMVDIGPSGGLDTAPGRNRQLRNYREALGMNKVGEVFRPRDMLGRMLTVKITHELYQGEPQERVNGVAGV